MTEAAGATEWPCAGCGRQLPDDPEGYRLGHSYGFGGYDDGHPDGFYGDGVFRYWCRDCTAERLRRDAATERRLLEEALGDRGDPVR